MFSEASQKARNIWFSNKNFQIPHVNGKYFTVPPPLGIFNFTRDKRKHCFTEEDVKEWKKIYEYQVKTSIPE